MSLAVKHAQALKTQNYKFIHNGYTRARGEPHMYKIFCAKCNDLVMIYQKDGRGRLLRCYFDRIHYPEELASEKKMECRKCHSLIGTKMIYKPEDRLAFRMKYGSFYMV